MVIVGVAVRAVLLIGEPPQALAQGVRLADTRLELGSLASTEGDGQSGDAKTAP